MTRSRLVLLAAMTVVVVGVAAGVGALWLSPARAAVGPLVGRGADPAGRRTFVIGLRRQALRGEPVLREVQGASAA